MDPRKTSSMKLARFISLAGIGSRRKAELLISRGCVEVNGSPVTDVAARVDPHHDAIRVNGTETFLPREFTYIILNKPPGYVCSSVSSRQHRSIYTLLPRGLASSLKYAGRLDVDSEGLILLTDDGELINRLTHPRYEHSKVYLVKISETPDRRSLQMLERGVILDDGATLPCRVELAEKSGDGVWLRMEIFEGRKRQIKRMFEAVGYKVSRLRRISIGPIELGRLRQGETRELSQEEAREARSATGIG